MLEAGALQQAASDHAAIAALAVNRDGRIMANLRRRDSEVIERPPRRVLNVSGVPLGLAADVEHLHSV